MNAQEYNFDGLIGPTHNFSGLAIGNIASAKSRYSVSHPKKAALQGLAKMRLLLGLGIKQGFIPPHERPNLTALKRDFKIQGSDREVLEKIGRKDFNLLLKYSSASSMWVANAATVSPSLDAIDNRVHMTPANLVSHKHRAIEAATTTAMLKHIFSDKKFFIHQPLKDNGIDLDEGAANHMRLSAEHGGKGIEVFVYGKRSRTKTAVERKYPSRQSREASDAVSRRHRLVADQTVFVQQNPAVIDQGVFHNDVIAVSNENVLLYHEDAFAGGEKAMDVFTEKFKKLSGETLCRLKIFRNRLTVREAVRSYFFNSQIVTAPAGKMHLIAPKECRDGGRIESLIREIISQDNPISRVHFVDLTESMKNGGGPACLRLRVVLTPKEAQSVHPGFILNEHSLRILEDWVKKHYRDELYILDLTDYQLLEESRASLDDLTRLLNLGSIYSFQR